MELELRNKEYKMGREFSTRRGKKHKERDQAK